MFTCSLRGAHELKGIPGPRRVFALVRLGVDAVLGYVMGEDHVEDYRLQVTDMLASDERVAVVASTSGRLGSRSIVNDFVHIIRIADGCVAEVHNYTWDQRAVAEFLAAAHA